MSASIPRIGISSSRAARALKKFALKKFRGPCHSRARYLVLFSDIPCEPTGAIHDRETEPLWRNPCQPGEAADRIRPDHSAASGAEAGRARQDPRLADQWLCDLPEYARVGSAQAGRERRAHP